MRRCRAPTMRAAKITLVKGRSQRSIGTSSEFALASRLAPGGRHDCEASRVAREVTTGLVASRFPARLGHSDRGLPAQAGVGFIRLTAPTHPCKVALRSL